jgi:hypothetical protein
MDLLKKLVSGYALNSAGSEQSLMVCLYANGYGYSGNKKAGILLAGIRFKHFNETPGV